MGSEFWFEVGIIFLLIVANGFFSGSEIAIISVRRSRIDQLIEEGKKPAQIVAHLKDDSDRFLATVQIGMTLVGSFASALGGASAIEFLRPIFHQSSSPFLQAWGEAIALGLIVTIISYLSLVIGELVPKSLALRYPEQIALAVARPLDIFSRLFSVDGETPYRLLQCAPVLHRHRRQIDRSVRLGRRSALSRQRGRRKGSLR